MMSERKAQESKQKEAQARRDQEKVNDHETTPASDIYGNVESKCPETGVEKPTQDAVEESVKWINENQR